MTRTLLHNAIIVNDNLRYRGYVVVEGETIALVGAGDVPSDVAQICQAATDCRGAMLLPGVIDTHVHCREPGMTHKGTIASETRAAVAGGVTSILDMPNVAPPTTSAETLLAKQERAAATAATNYACYVGATHDNIEWLVDGVDYSRVPGIKVFMGSSTGGMLLDDESALHRLFANAPARIAVHSEDEGIIRQNLAEFRAHYGDDIPLRCHPLIRSAEACVASTRRAIALAEATGARLHVLHVTTAAELELLATTRANVTAEACVGHLALCDDDYDTLGTRIKVNPAVKTAADRDALRRAVASGAIATVSTDHAPHLLSEKAKPYVTCPSGMPLVQFSLVTMLELARQGHFGVERVVEVMSHAPARLFGIECRGFIAPGNFADLTLVAPDDAGHTISDADVLSPCGWTPLTGLTVHHRVVTTWVNGHQAYHAGQVSPTLSGQPLRFTSTHHP